MGYFLHKEWLRTLSKESSWEPHGTLGSSRNGRCMSDCISKVLWTSQSSVDVLTKWDETQLSYWEEMGTWKWKETVEARGKLWQIIFSKDGHNIVPSICSSHPIPYALFIPYAPPIPSHMLFLPKMWLCFHQQELSLPDQWVSYAIAWQAEYDKQFPGTDLGGPSAFSSWPLEILALERPMHGTQSLLSHLPWKYEDSPTPGYCTKHIPQGETQEKETSCREELAHMQQRHHSCEKRKKSSYRASVGR